MGEQVASGRHTLLYLCSPLCVALTTLALLTNNPFLPLPRSLLIASLAGAGQ